MGRMGIGRGGNRAMRRAMSGLGISSREMEGVDEVVIRMRGVERVLASPRVTLVETRSADTMYLVTASEYEERSSARTFPADDVAMVRDRAGLDEAEAIAALTETDGDVIEAIARQR